MSEIYKKKLRHPLWQKRRTEIMNRDRFRCAWCNDDNNTLNVHHLHYIKGREPWEYTDDFLVTLCEACHNLCHFAGELQDLKSHIMARHGDGTLPDNALKYLFFEHGLRHL